MKIEPTHFTFKKTSTSFLRSGCADIFIFSIEKKNGLSCGLKNMGCLKLTYLEEPNLFLDEPAEKTEPFKLKVWVNPGREFSGVDDVVAQQGGPGDGDYAWYQFFNDHNPGGDFLYEVNKWNPIANIYNAISTYVTGEDSYGVKQNNATATLQLASSIPIGKISGGIVKVGNFIVNSGALTHIFRNAVGHVNPTTVASQNRFLSLFSSVASNPNNLVPTVNLAAREAGVLTYQQNFANGQVWVQIRDGVITNAGVNRIP